LAQGHRGVPPATAGSEYELAGMNQHPDYETWVVEAGDDIITKRARGVRLSPLERLVYCLWVADYGDVQEQIRLPWNGTKPRVNPGERRA